MSVSAPPVLQVSMLATPIGTLAVAWGPEGLVGVDFDVGGEVLAERLRRRVGPCSLVDRSSPAVTALRAYFEGDLGALDTLPVASMGTPFQRLVWTGLRKIPVGQTTTYGQLAATVGRPAAVRAVGAANGDNPVAIVVPCHRVIGASGKLVGYGGGIERKRWLLRHEGSLLV